MFVAPGWVEIMVIAVIALLLIAPIVGCILLIAFLTQRGSGKPQTEVRVQCPQCAEWIVRTAIKCRHCGAQLGDKLSEERVNPVR